MDDEREAATRTFAGRFQPASFSVIGIEESAKSDMYKHPEAPADGNVQALGHAKLTAPDISGNPGALNLPAVPAFRKGLRGQKKLCLFQPLRNGGTVGAYNAAGLPDITGRVQMGSMRLDGTNMIVIGPVNVSGCFGQSDSLDGYPATPLTSETSHFYKYTNFAASRCSTVYGASSTVMPSSSDMVVGLYLGRSA